MILTSVHLRNLAQIFKNEGYTLYITGGYVRDCLLYGGAVKTDIDICASASVDEVKRILSGGTYCIKERNSALGTVAIVSESGEAYEYTTFRRDSYRGGAHNPAEVVFVGSVAEDALRRDFTVNSIYFDLIEEKIVDPLDGMADLKNKLLRASDKPEITFGSDGLRLLRLARFAAVLGFEIEPRTRAAAVKMSALIREITRPRINEEFFKILNADEGDTAYMGLKLLKELGLLFYIIPELEASDNFAQNKKWHEYDVLEHTFQAVKFCTSETRMAALLHDIGKPESELRHGKSIYHTQIALEIAPRILKEFGYSQARAARVLRLIEHHMYDGDAETGENKTKKFLLKNQDILDDLLILKQADYLAKGKETDICPTVAKWRNIYDKMKAGPLHIKDLQITPEELIKEMKGTMPQSDTARVLEKLLEAVAVEGLKNEYENLLKHARSNYI